MNNKNLSLCQNDINNPNLAGEHQNILNERGLFHNKYHDAIIGIPDSFYADISEFNRMLKKHLVKSNEQMQVGNIKL